MVCPLLWFVVGGRQVRAIWLDTSPKGQPKQPGRLVKQVLNPYCGAIVEVGAPFPEL